MILIHGNGKIDHNLTLQSAIEKLKQAQKDGDKNCSVLGAWEYGITWKEVEKAAGYSGSTETECLEALEALVR